MRFVRPILVVSAICVALLGSCYLLVFTPWNPPCITTSRKTIADPAGYEFEITDTYCSMVAHTANADICVRRKGEARQTLLFEYDPVEIAGLPSVRVIDDNKIMISVPWVNEVFARRDRWRGMQIEYKIGRVDYESKPKRLDDE